MTILEKIQQGFTFFDGACGTYLPMLGYNGTGILDTLNLEQPALVTKYHEHYLQAGADVITTNTFSANPYKLSHTQYQMEQIIPEALKLAKAAVKNVGGKNRFIALDFGPTGQMLAPLGTVSFDEIYDVYKRAALLGEQNGADLVLVETMSDIYELKAAVLAVKENTSLPVFATMTVGENDHTLTGSGVTVIASVLQSLGVNALGLNCSKGPKDMVPLARALSEHSSVPVMIQPNAGMPKTENGRITYDYAPALFAAYGKELAQNGATILGGCCGTTPEHIQAMVTELNQVQPVCFKKASNQFGCSYQQAVCFGEKAPACFLISAQSSDLTEELKSGTYDSIVDLAFEAVDEEADYILLSLDEAPQKAGLIRDILLEVQQLVKLPIALKSEKPEAINEYLRYYNGRCMVQSASQQAYAQGRGALLLP